MVYTANIHHGTVVYAASIHIRLPKEVDLTALLRDSVISLSTLLSVFVTIHLVYHSYRSYLIKEVLLWLSIYLRFLYTKLFIVALIIYSFLHRPTILQSNPSSGSSPPNLSSTNVHECEQQISRMPPKSRS